MREGEVGSHLRRVVILTVGSDEILDGIVSASTLSDGMSGNSEGNVCTGHHQFLFRCGTLLVGCQSSVSLEWVIDHLARDLHLFWQADW